MISVKRNSREFKQVKDLLEDYEGKKGAKRYIRLYALKPYEDLDKAILLNGKGTDADVRYALAYDSLLDYIRYNRSKRLHRLEDRALYFFQSSPAAKWKEAPFELMGKLKKEVMPLRAIKTAAASKKTVEKKASKKAPVKILVAKKTPTVKRVIARLKKKNAARR
jgi:hypothetical protein